VTCLRGAPTPSAVPGHRTSFRTVVAAGCGEWLLREVSRVAQLPRPASEHVRSLHNSPPALRDSDCSRSRPDLDAACRDQRIFDVHPLVFCRPDCGRHRPGVRTCASFRAAQLIHTPQVRELLGGQLDHCTLRLPNSCASDTACVSGHTLTRRHSWRVLHPRSRLHRRKADPPREAHSLPVKNVFASRPNLHPMRGHIQQVCVADGWRRRLASHLRFQQPLF
jgi:hypothetical protein